MNQKYGETLISYDAASPSSLTLQDRQPNPPRWRRWLPGWLRSLFWVDGAVRYDAFLSYSWEGDREVATAIQHSLQQNFRPWYRTRAKNIFRDLACLPAGSNLEKELAVRLDRSKHLIVLACPSAAHSRGMEFEADHWFRDKRDGEVIIIVSAGTYSSWTEIAELAVPAAIRNGLTTTPLWINLSSGRDQLVAHADDPQTRAQLRNDLRQVFLRLHAVGDWDQLQGQERSQRIKLFRYAAATAILFAFLATIAFVQFLRADRNAAEALKAAEAEAVARKEAENQRDRVGKQRDQLLWQSLVRESVRLSGNRVDDDLAALLAYQALTIYKRAPIPTEYLVEDALQQTAQKEPRGHQLVGHTDRVYAVAFSPNSELLASASIDGTVRVWSLQNPTKEPAVLRNTVSPPSLLTDALDTRALTSVAISRDGRLSAVAADGALLLWDLNALAAPPKSKRPEPTLLTPGG